MLFLLARLYSSASFLFLCVTRSRLLVLVIPFFGLLFFAFLDPTLGRLGNPMGLEFATLRSPRVPPGSLRHGPLLPGDSVGPP